MILNVSLPFVKVAVLHLGLLTYMLFQTYFIPLSLWTILAKFIERKMKKNKGRSLIVSKGRSLELCKPSSLQVQLKALIVAFLGEERAFSCQKC